MRITSFLLGLTLIVMLLVPVGCDENGEEEERVDVAEEEVSMVDLLQRAQDVDGMSADFQATEHDTGQEFTGTMWIQDQQRKIETDDTEDFDVEDLEETANISFETLVYITDQEAREHTIYLPEENLAYKHQLPGAEEIETPQEQAEEIDETDAEDAEYLGTERIDGVECHGWRLEQAAQTTEMWLHNEYGLPMKTEVFENDELMFTTEFSNLVVEELPADTFELPDNVEMLDMQDMIPGDMPEDIQDDIPDDFQEDIPDDIEEGVEDLF